MQFALLTPQALYFLGISAPAYHQGKNLCAWTTQSWWDSSCNVVANGAFIYRSAVSLCGSDVALSASCPPKSRWTDRTCHETILLSFRLCTVVSVWARVSTPSQMLASPHCALCTGWSHTVTSFLCTRFILTKANRRMKADVLITEGRIRLPLQQPREDSLALSRIRFEVNLKPFPKQSAGLRSQQLCLLRSPPWLGCVWGCGKPQSIHQIRQSPTVNSHSKDCQERWSASMTALMSFDKDFFFVFIIIMLGCMLRRKKMPFLISKIQQKTPSLLGSIHIQQSWGAFTDWTKTWTLASPCIRWDQLQSRVMLTWRDAVLCHTNTSAYVSTASSDLCFLYICQNHTELGTARWSLLRESACTNGRT